MSEFTGDLKGVFDVEDRHGDDEGAARVEQLTRQFHRKLRRAWLTMVLILGVCVVVMGAAAWFLHRTTDVKAMLWCVLVFIAMYEGTILMKLWFWVVDAKISILRELKELRLEVAALAEEKKRGE